MGSGELYNLRWNDFQSCLSSSVGDLLEDSDFTDVTLACTDGQNFSVHKIVLSACSQYFKKVLKRNPCQHPVIILKDVSANILHSLIDFIYHGAADVPQDSINEFLKTAQALDIKGLAEDNEQEKKSQFDSRGMPSSQNQRNEVAQRNVNRKRFSPYPQPEQRSRTSLSNQHSSSSINIQSQRISPSMSVQTQRSSPSMSVQSQPERRQKPVFPVERALVKPEQHEDVMERLQKRDLSIYKTDREQTPQQSEVLNIKEEKVEESGSKSEESGHFLEEAQQDDASQFSQADYEQGDYDEAYAEGYDDSQLGMFADYEGGGGGMFPCDQCGRVYKSSNSLRRHVNTECGKLPQFKCPHCPYMSKHKADLNRHCRLRHERYITYTT